MKRALYGSKHQHPLVWLKSAVGPEESSGSSNGKHCFPEIDSGLAKIPLDVFGFIESPRESQDPNGSESRIISQRGPLKRFSLFSDETFEVKNLPIGKRGDVYKELELFRPKVSSQLVNSNLEKETEILPWRSLLLILVDGFCRIYVNLRVRQEIESNSCKWLIER